MIITLKQGARHIEDNEGIYHEFLCSSSSDITTLPTGIDSEAIDRPRPGSTAIVVATNSLIVYVLDNSRTWVEVE